MSTVSSAAETMYQHVRHRDQCHFPARTSLTLRLPSFTTQHSLLRGADAVLLARVEHVAHPGLEPNGGEVRLQRYARRALYDELLHVRRLPLLRPRLGAHEAVVVAARQEAAVDAAEGDFEAGDEAAGEVQGSLLLRPGEACEGCDQVPQYLVSLRLSLPHRDALPLSQWRASHRDLVLLHAVRARAGDARCDWRVREALARRRRP